MGLVTVSSPSPPPSLLALSRSRRAPSHLCPPPLRYQRPPPRLAVFRPSSFTSKCSVTDVDVELKHIETEDEVPQDIPSIPSGCSIPFVHLPPDIFDSDSLDILKGDSYTSDILTTIPVLSEEEQDALAATPAHPLGLYALYASSLAGNLVEQMWSFAWPAAVAILHPSLLPVAIVSFFTKLSVFIGGPLVGSLMDYFPRIPAYYSLNLVQTAAQLLSAAMVIYGLGTVRQISASALLLQPWFVVLVVAGAVERLMGLALGVTVERDWVVLLAGRNRPIALAKANAMLNRLDLLCEIAGASIFGVLMSKYDPVTCLKLASWLMICTLPVLVILGHLTNRLSSGVLDSCKSSLSCDKSFRANNLLNMKNIVDNGIDAIRNGWAEYQHQPVLPASVAYVLLFFNIALAPGAIMTAFLMHHGTSPSVIGGFSGLCALMGVAATFISANLVKKLGILKAGAAGLLFQALLLLAALVVFMSGSTSQQKPILVFLTLIVLSRLGHMSYDVVGTQILQTGIPVNKANLLGATEVSIASLAEFVMLGVAIIANDVSHFGFLAMLSVSSVIGAAWIFCRWLANPTDEQRKLFSFDTQF